MSAPNTLAHTVGFADLVLSPYISPPWFFILFSFLLCILILPSSIYKTPLVAYITQGLVFSLASSLTLLLTLEHHYGNSPTFHILAASFSSLFFSFLSIRIRFASPSTAPMVTASRMPPPSTPLPPPLLLPLHAYLHQLLFPPLPFMRRLPLDPPLRSLHSLSKTWNTTASWQPP